MNNLTISPFVKATIALFQDYLGVEVQDGEPEILKADQEYSNVSAIIGLGGHVAGIFVMWFSMDISLMLVSKLAGQEYTEFNEEVVDGIGEVINIVAGNAKMHIGDKTMVLSIPSIVTGNQYKINWPQNKPIIEVPFKSSLGEFCLGISVS